MLIKVTENQFINIKRCILVKNFYDKDEEGLCFFSDSNSDGDISIDKTIMNMELLEYHLKSNDFIGLGSDLVNISKVSSVEINEEATLIISFGDNLDFEWKMSKITEKDIDNFFKYFHIESVVKE